MRKFYIGGLFTLTAALLVADWPGPFDKSITWIAMGLIIVCAGIGLCEIPNDSDKKGPVR